MHLTCSPEIQIFLREIEQSFLQVLNNYVPADQQEKEAIQLRDMVEGIGNSPSIYLLLSLMILILLDIIIIIIIINPNVENFELNYLEIQPLVIPAYRVDCENIRDFKETPIPNIPMAVIRRIPTINLTWLKSLAENYGAETFERFAIFCDDWHIWDLHNENIGFSRTPEVELPIILDWMSD